MSGIAIRTEGLGKRYVIARAGEGERYRLLRDALAHSARAVVRGVLGRGGGQGTPGRGSGTPLWALEDVSFTVGRGEVVGIIGRNGAGKSTLLKVLSRITEPSAGRAMVAGRVASLLEAGTGFHRELTGRENIYLNGAILGMTRAEIRRRFEAIVAFSGCEAFLEVPVKRYSNGMYVRLAFAVAAHLEPDILIVDEVLAVGDAEFRRKCLGKMQDAAGGGRTVLFVSHDMAAIAALSRRALLLAGGRLVADGPVEEVVARYMREASTAAALRFPVRPGRPSIVSVAIDEAALRRGDIGVRIGFAAPANAGPVVCGLLVKTRQGQPVWGSRAGQPAAPRTGAPGAVGATLCQAVGLPLAAGEYLLSAWLGDGHQQVDLKADVLAFSFRTGTSASRPAGELAGPLEWEAVWTTVPPEIAAPGPQATGSGEAAFAWPA